MWRFKIVKFYYIININNNNDFSVVIYINKLRYLIHKYYCNGTSINEISLKKSICIRIGVLSYIPQLLQANQ